MLFLNSNYIKFYIINILYIFRFSKIFNKYIYVNACLFFLKPLKKKKNFKLKNNNIFFITKSRTLALLSKFRRLIKFNILGKKKKILKLVLLRKRSLLKRKYNFKKLLFKKNYKRIKKTTYLRKKFYYFKDFKNKKKKKFSFLEKKTFLNSRFKSYLSKNKTFFLKKKGKKHKHRVFINVFRKFIKNLKINRNLIKELFFKKFTKQHKITNFLKKFDQSRNINVLTTLQSFIYIILLNCQFFKFKTDVFFFIKKFGVFVNGILCFNPYKILQPSDIIQLPIVKQFYYFYKKQEHMSILFYKKYRKKYNKLYASPRVKWYYRSKNIPSWVYKLIYFNSDIPTCYEVDYIILTICVLGIKNLHFNSFFFKKYISLCFIRMYNWRKIT